MASYTPVSNKLNFAVAFNPTTAFPLDARSIFGSKTAATAAAATAENAGSTNTVYYFGMPIVVFENDVATMYIIQGDKTLKEVGAAPLFDGATIEIVDGKLQLKDFGKQYYAFHEADVIHEGEWTYPDGMPTDPADGDWAKVGTSWFQYQTDTWIQVEEEPHQSDWYEMVTGWKAGLEPKVVSAAGNTYELAWYEPSTTTIEGVSAIVSNMQTEIEAFNTRLGDLETEVETLLTQGVVNVDGTTIVKDPESGVLSVGNISVDNIGDFEGAIEDAKTAILTDAKDYADQTFVSKTNVVAAGMAASDVDAASDSRVASEKMVVSQLSWIEGM